MNKEKIKKDLLLVFNIFGEKENEEQQIKEYIVSLNSILLLIFCYKSSKLYLQE